MTSQDVKLDKGKGIIFFPLLRSRFQDQYHIQNKISTQVYIVHLYIVLGRGIKKTQSLEVNYY